MIKNEYFDYEIVKDNIEVDNTMPKYIMYECVDHGMCGGIADRLKGIFSTYAWSLLTNRTFLINVEQPCSLTQLYSIGNENETHWNDPYPSNKNIYGTKIAKFYFNYGKFYELLAREDLNKISPNAHLIKVRTGSSFLNVFGENHFLKELIKEHGYDPKKFKVPYLMHDWYNKLFKLAPKLQDKYDAFAKKLKEPVNGIQPEIICVQIRIGNQKYASILNPERKFLELNEIDIYWKFINENLLKNKKEKLYRFFVTSDVTEVKNIAIKEFGNYEVFYYNSSNSHIDRSFKDLKECGEELENLILDFHTLQNCDIAVVGHSGFGLLGVWNRPVPNKDLYVLTNPNDIKHDYWNRKNVSFVKVDNIDKLFFL